MAAFDATIELAEELGATSRRAACRTPRTR